MTMLRKLCLHCGVTCWHNTCAAKDRAPRCTFCGHPASVVGNAGTPKRELALWVAARQASRARTLNITVA